MIIQYSVPHVGHGCVGRFRKTQEMTAIISNCSKLYCKLCGVGLILAENIWCANVSVNSIQAATTVSVVYYFFSSFFCLAAKKSALEQIHWPA